MPAVEDWDAERIKSIMDIAEKKGEDNQNLVEWLQYARDMLATQVPFFRALCACKTALGQMTSSTGDTVPSLQKSIEDPLNNDLGSK